MAGQLFPFSALPQQVEAFPVVLAAAHPEALGWAASLVVLSTWRLFYRVPPVIPSGTPKLLMSAQADATTGDAVIQVNYEFFDALDVPGSLTAEDSVDTFTFATTAFRLTEIKRTLDAVSWTGKEGQLLKIDLDGIVASSVWTLANNFGLLRPPVIWE